MIILTQNTGTGTDNKQMITFKWDNPDTNNKAYRKCMHSKGKLVHQLNNIKLHALWIMMRDDEEKSNQ